MRRIKSSTVAVALSSLALFAALGGTSWASGLWIGTSQIRNGAVTTGKLANNSVTGSKVEDGSLTAADIAPDTFLAADGTATDSNELGGTPASDFLQGAGRAVAGRIKIDAGQSRMLLDLGIGYVDGNCLAGGKPELSYTAEVAPVNLVEWATNYGGSTDVNTTNGLTVGNSYIEPNSSVTPQAVTFQAAENDGSGDHVATAWTTGQDIGLSSCIFTGQGITTG